MDPRASAPPLTHRRVLTLAWPIILAQAASATPGMVDTAVMGLYGRATDLAAVAVASVCFSFLYWGFGFLRMSTTGLAAQAVGAHSAAEANAVLVRSLALGAGLGLGLLLSFPVLEQVALFAFQAPQAAEEGARAYFSARIGGAPAALMGFALTGWLLGTGRTRGLLVFQLVLNGVNAGLDAALVGFSRWGPAGIGAGTALSEWVACALGLFLVRDGLRFGGVGLWDRRALAAMLSVNRDVMIRTLALLFCFAWFVNGSGVLGEATLAGNQILLQLVAVSAFVLDAFAFVAEKEVGEAFGARDPAALSRAMRITSKLAVLMAAGFSALFFLAGAPLIEGWVRDPEALRVAVFYLPWCAAVPLVAVPAWQLDGIFLGATQGRALRNAAVAATVLYCSTDLLLRSSFGNSGAWSAFLAMYAYRAVTLGAFLPALRRAVSPGAMAGSER